MERTNYGEAIIPVVDDYGTLVQKVVINEYSERTVFIPLRCLDTYGWENNLYYWVSK